MNAETDGEGEEEGEEPCEDHDAVIPGDIPNNEGPRDDSCCDEDCSEDESGRCDGEDDRPTIWNASIVGGGRIGHIEDGIGRDMDSSLVKLGVKLTEIENGLTKLEPLLP